MPCLTTAAPVPGDDHGRHRGDVHGVRAVAAGADDVHGRAGNLDARRVREHRVGQAGELLDGLALGPQRDEERRRAGRRGLTGHHLGPSPRRLPPAQVVPADERGEQVGPVGRRGEICGDGYARLARRRGSSATACLQPRRGRAGAATHGVGQRPGREPGVLRAAGEDQHRRALVDLVLELAAQPHAAGLVGLAVEDQQVQPARCRPVRPRRQGWRPRSTRCRARLRQARRPTASRTCSRGVRVVAVQQDSRARGAGAASHLCWSHPSSSPVMRRSWHGPALSRAADLSAPLYMALLWNRVSQETPQAARSTQDFVQMLHASGRPRCRRSGHLRRRQ